MSNKDNPLVSIISVNYNQLEVTYEMLDSLRRLSFTDFEVILVDNASRENPERAIRDRYPEVVFIRSEDNLGFAGGNNLGVKQSQGDFLFFVNNDTVLTEGLIENMLAHFEEHPKSGIASPLIYYFEKQDGHELIQYAGATPVHSLTARNSIIGEKELDKGQYTLTQQTAFAHGAAMMVPRYVIEKAGLMTEYFFLYYEELDWCEKIKNAGFQIHVVPKAKIYHKESVSVGPMSTLKTYYLNRNRILFMRRNKGAGQKILFFLFWGLITMPRWTITYLIKGKWEHLKAFYKATFWNLKNEKYPVNRAIESGKSRLSASHSEV